MTPDGPESFNDNYNTGFLVSIIWINIYCFFTMGIDKWLLYDSKSNQNGRPKIFQLSLIAPVIICGPIGLLLGMIIFKHKTRQISFYIEFLLAIIIWMLFFSHYSIVYVKILSFSLGLYLYPPLLALFLALSFSDTSTQSMY